MKRGLTPTSSASWLSSKDLLAGLPWRLLSTAAGAVSHPSAVAGRAGWIRATVPGTAASALRDEYGEPSAREADYDGLDWWWSTSLDLGPRARSYLLNVGGIATLGEVWVQDRMVLVTENMFRSYTVELADLSGVVDVYVHVMALPGKDRRGKRPRWKSDLVPDQSMRFLRTTLLGRIPAWAGDCAPVGPWRPVTLRELSGAVVLRHVKRASVENSAGLIDVEVAVTGAIRSAQVAASGITAKLHPSDDGTLHGTVRVPDVELWWPHTHGRQPLYPVDLIVDGAVTPLGRAGFRTVRADSAGGGFTLLVNDVPIFMRGACWSPLDPISLQASSDELHRALAQVRSSGMNMLRIVGTMVYEDDSFYEACDSLGIMVWQDCMLSTLDPPADDSFLANLSAEVGQLVDRVADRPCMAVLCGGSETEQRPVMLGMRPESAATLAQTEVIPAILAGRHVHLPYVTSTPTGGDLPTHVRRGVAHYFGVGAYLLPLSDARTAGVRFAAECLAFSTPPEKASVDRNFSSSRVAGHHPAWKAGVPRDNQASFDFEDVRDYYVREIFGVDPMLVRRDDPDRYLDLGRAAVCATMTEVFTQWRRPSSVCAGGLVLSWQDLRPGAGWGLIDSDGVPKAPWYALARILAPVAILVSDDNLDGIFISLINDTAEACPGTLLVRTWSPEGDQIDRAAIEVEIPARDALELSWDRILGAFSDSGHAHRFGPRSRDVIHVSLARPDGLLLADHVAMLGQHLRPMQRGGLSGAVVADGDEWYACLNANRTAQWVALSSSDWCAADGWFHMTPGMTRRVRLSPLSARPGRRIPSVSVRALNIEETQLANE